MSASILKGAKNVKIRKSQFNNIVAGRDVHQTNHTGDTYNTNSNNKSTTKIKDSFNDNSRHISGGDRRRKPQPRPQRNPKLATRSVRARARANPHSAPAVQHVQLEPDVCPATPPIESASSEQHDTRPAPPHTVSAPVVPTQAAPEPPTPASLPPTSAPPYLALPLPQPQSTNTSSTSLTQSVATSPSIAHGSPSLEPHRSGGMGKPDLSARYRHLDAQEETRYEIRRKLVSVAQSMAKDKFFILKDQATTANSILELIEGSKEKIQAKEEVVRLCLESHAVVFVAIMAAETQTPHERKSYNLLKTLNNVEELMSNIVHKNGLSRMHPFKKSENERLVKTYRKELEAWLRDFQNDNEATIDFALHKASKVLSVALSAEQQYTLVVPEPHAHQPFSASPAPLTPNSQPQWPPLSQGSTSVSGVSKGAVSTGSGSAAAISVEGSGNHQIHQNSHNNNSVNYY